MGGSESEHADQALLEKVRRELRRYRHLALSFDAERSAGGGVELVIRFRNPPPGAHVYRAPLHPRDVESSQFAWNLQRYLYDCMHDYLVELFITTPQSRTEEDDTEPS